MKKLICAMLVAAASAAFADGDDNIAVLVSTTGPDCYQNGATVLDGECYALVWSRDGVFEGFTADGAPIDTNDCVVNVGAVAKGGRCRAAIEVSASLAAELENGVYAYTEKELLLDMVQWSRAHNRLHFHQDAAFEIDSEVHAFRRYRTDRNQDQQQRS